jgi:hypothetical protein
VEKEERLDMARTVQSGNCSSTWKLMDLTFHRFKKADKYWELIIKTVLSRAVFASLRSRNFPFGKVVTKLFRNRMKETSLSVTLLGSSVPSVILTSLALNLQTVILAFVTTAGKMKIGPVFSFCDLPIFISSPANPSRDSKRWAHSDSSIGCRL